MHIDTFTSLEFKTATERLTSICQIGLVRIVNGKCIGEFSILVQPPNNYYWDSFIEKHRINPLVTDRSPKFSLLWNKIEQFIHNQNVIVPNSKTIECLNQTLEFYRLPKPCLIQYNISDIFKEDYNLLKNKYNFVSDSDDALNVAKSCAMLFEFSLFRKK